MAQPWRHCPSPSSCWEHRVLPTRYATVKRKSRGGSHSTAQGDVRWDQQETQAFTLLSHHIYWVHLPSQEILQTILTPSVPPAPSLPSQLPTAGAAGGIIGIMVWVVMTAQGKGKQSQDKAVGSLLYSIGEALVRLLRLVLLFTFQGNSSIPQKRETNIIWEALQKLNLWCQNNLQRKMR